KAEAPIWNNFLKETFQNNQDLISYVQRAVGYSMSADMSEQVMFILLGEGNNGKSVFLNVLEDAFGTYSMNMQPSTIASKVGSQSADSDIARLKGARLVTTTEPNKGMKLDEGRVKQLTGGDTVTARFLYGSEFEFKPEFKIWMATNHKPVISGTDDGIWRRMAVIPFEYKVPKSKIDKKLTAKLKGELSGILRWCVEGYQSWREIGLEEPQIVKDQRDTYRDEMDMVHAFISDKCVKSSDASVRKSDLWSTFQDWVKENNEYSKMSSRKFYKEIDKHYQVSKTKSGLRYVGIGLQFDDLQKTQITSVLDSISELG
ncbi:phage/plasmid primase, P4 family, partial [Jeotgalibaca porci]